MQHVEGEDQAKSYGNISKRQGACVACREAHLRCNGAPKCGRCLQEGRQCRFGIDPAASVEKLPICSHTGFKLSGTCFGCRCAHVRCSGGWVCSRCARNGKSCYFIPSRRGQRRKRSTEGIDESVVRSTHTPGFSANNSGGNSILEKDVDFKAGPILLREPPEVGSPVERRALLFYCEDMMPSLVSANETASYFWGHLIPQASQSEAAIRHMLVACSSWAEMMVATPQNQQTASYLARQHHTKALAALTQPYAKPSVTVMLAACVLLVLRESTEDPIGDMSDLWIFHTLAGLSILREYLNAGRQGPEADAIINDIQPIFIQLEFIMSMFSPASIKTIPEPGQSKPQLPDSFEDHAHMRDTFCEIYRWRYHKAGEVASDWTACSPLFNDIHGLLQEWYQPLLLYLSDLPPSPVARHCVAVIWAQYRMIYAGFLSSVRTDVPELKYYCPLVIDVSRPWESAVIRNSLTSFKGPQKSTELSEAKAFDSLIAKSRGRTLPDPAPTGLWPITSILHSDSPRDVTLVFLHAPGTGLSRPSSSECLETFTSTQHSTSMSLEDSTLGIEDGKQEQPIETFQFINVGDPQWRTRARSHLTRQQRRVNGKGGKRAL